MREAVGGTMLFWIVLTFVAIFIGFMAAVTQYGKVFRIKNSIVNYIEQGEGIAYSEDLENFKLKLQSLGYGKIDAKSGKFVLCRSDFKGATRDGSYYYVKLFVRFEIPLAPAMEMGISGDTRLVETGIRINDTGEVGWTFSERYSKDCIASHSNLLWYLKRIKRITYS